MRCQFILHTATPRIPHLPYNFLRIYRSRWAISGRHWKRRDRGWLIGDE
jgi:hypothetical protein